MRFRTCLCPLWLVLSVIAAGPAAMATDRLERFRELAGAELSALELQGSGASDEAVREIYALLDDEILESLDAGGVFASEGFLQERLEAFADVWGGSAFQVVVLPGGALTVGSFQLTSGEGGNSVRVYRRVGGRAERLSAIHRAGTPHVFPMPPTRAGQAQFLAVWVGPLSPRGTPALRAELWRHEGDRLRLAWSTAELFGPDFDAISYSVREHGLVVRYAPRYPGWKLGCEGQTEHEDQYRYVPGSGTLVLARRHVENGWHRDLHATVERFLAALRAGDARALAALGAPAQSGQLPARLEPEPVCDVVEGSSPQVAVVSARAPDDPRPWGLRFRRSTAGWRFAGAERLTERPGTAVLQWKSQ